MEHERLPTTRSSVTHRAVIHAEDGRVKFFVTVGLYPDGRPGEVFLTFDQIGSTIDGFSDCWAVAVSFSLQSGVPLSKLVSKFAHQEFEPKGRTDNPDIPFTSSVVDYVVRWMALKFARGCGTPSGSGGSRTAPDRPQGGPGTAIRINGSVDPPLPLRRVLHASQAAPCPD